MVLKRQFTALGLTLLWSFTAHATLWIVPRVEAAENASHAGMRLVAKVILPQRSAQKSAYPTRQELGGLRPCTDYFDTSVGANGNQYKDSNCFSITQLTTSGAITRLRLVYPAWYVTPGPTGDSLNDSSERWQSAIEYPSGTINQNTFKGSQWGIADPGSTLITDPLFISVPGQTSIAARNYAELIPLYSGTVVSVAGTAATSGLTITLPANIPNDPALTGATLVITSGTGYSTGSRVFCKIASTSMPSGNVIVAQDSTYYVNSTINNTTTFTIYPSPTSPVRLTSVARTTGDYVSNGYNRPGHNYVMTPFSSIPTLSYVRGLTSSAQYPVTPVVGLGDPITSSVAILGDSILDGTYNSGNKSSPTNGSYDASFAELSLFGSYGVPNFGIVKLGDSGGTYAECANNLMTRRLWVASLCDYAIVSYGTNDIWNGESLQQLQANAIALWKTLYQSGVQVYACTVTPRTTDSANLWIMQNGQATNPAYEPIRVAYNNWLRAVPSPYLAGVFDTTALVEANAFNQLTLNGGYWYVGPNIALSPGSSTYSAVLNGSTITGTSTTIVDTADFPSDNIYHFVGQVMEVVSAADGSVHDGIITAYSNSSHTATCSAGFSGAYTPATGDKAVIRGNCATAISGGQGIHPGDFGSLLMSGAINTSLFAPIARIPLGVFGELSLRLVPEAYGA